MAENVGSVGVHPDERHRDFIDALFEVVYEAQPLAAIRLTSERREAPIAGLVFP